MLAYIDWTAILLTAAGLWLGGAGVIGGAAVMLAGPRRPRTNRPVA